jgi:hypothetical protein
MYRSLIKFASLVAVIFAGSFGIWFYQDRFASQRVIQRLEEEKRVLNQVVERLSDEKRVAEALVTSQQTVNGITHSTLLFVETDRTGKTLPPKSFEIEGSVAHVDALVIKFERDFVKQGDPLRGHSIALFTRIYGDQQAPASAYPMDAPGTIPDIYRDADPRVSDFELALWKDFWKLADDPNFRAEKGVRVADGQGVWRPIQPDMLYTITIEADGGLNMTSKPVEGIYREALKRRAAGATTGPY